MVHKAIYLASYYNSETSNEERYLNSFIIEAGDVNLLCCDWKTKQLQPNTQHVNIHHKFADILDDHGISQLVEEPTIRTNILDLILTNLPESVSRTDTIPGISYHGIKYTEVIRYEQRSTKN